MDQPPDWYFNLRKILRTKLRGYAIAFQEFNICNSFQVGWCWLSLRLARLENIVSNLKTTLTLQPRQIAFKYTNFSLKNIILAASLYHLFEYIRCLKKKKKFARTTSWEIHRVWKIVNRNFQSPLNCNLLYQFKIIRFLNWLKNWKFKSR